MRETKKNNFLYKSCGVQANGNVGNFPIIKFCVMIGYSFWKILQMLQMIWLTIKGNSSRVCSSGIARVVSESFL
jgi:hypothetical protein